MGDLSVSVHQSAGVSPIGAQFVDHFLGSSIDPLKWTVYNRIGDLANSELECMAPANVTVAGSLLSITSIFADRTCGDTANAPQTMHYTSGQIAQATAPFLYGTIDFRAKMAGGTGIWPDLWMLGNRWQASQPSLADDPAADGADPNWGEIDIAEFMSNARTQMNTAAHVGSSDGTHLVTLPFDATTRFMVYRLIWTSTQLTWAVDAEDGNGFQVLRTLTGARVPVVPFYVVINQAVGGTGGGTPDSATFPLTMQVDYVRVT